MRYAVNYYHHRILFHLTYDEQLGFNLPARHVQSIVATSALQHYSHRLVDIVIAEWWRVLDIGATLYITNLPSLHHMASAILQNHVNITQANIMVFGEASNSTGSDYNFVGFDSQSISARLVRHVF